jgi:hypothetical protein
MPGKSATEKARDLIAELWEHYRQWLDYGGTVPLWLASMEPKLRDAAESIEKEKSL